MSFAFPRPSRLAAAHATLLSSQAGALTGGENPGSIGSCCPSTAPQGTRPVRFKARSPEPPQPESFPAQLRRRVDHWRARDKALRSMQEDEVDLIEVKERSIAGSSGGAKGGRMEEGA